MKTEPDHILLGMSNADYHAHQAVGKSGLDLLNRSPAHYAFGAPRKATAAMSLGTLVHAALLEPERYAAEIIVVDAPDRRSAIYKQAVEAAGGNAERVILKELADQVDAIHAAAMSNPLIERELENPHGQAEASIFVTEPETGVRIKCRPDWMVGHAIYDLKTTSDATHDALARSVINYRYFVQQAHYQLCAELLFRKPVPFVFWFIETEPPYSTVVVTLPDDVVAYGRREVMRLLRLYATCLETNRWPGPPDAVEGLAMPSWFIGMIENDAEVIV